MGTTPRASPKTLSKLQRIGKADQVGQTSADRRMSNDISKYVDDTRGFFWLVKTVLMVRNSKKCCLQYSVGEKSGR